MFGHSRIIALLLGAVSLSALATSAYAADAIVEEPVRTGFNWTGFYIGGAVGAGAFLIEEEEQSFLSGDGVFGEITAGYDHLFSERFLLGAFVDARYGGQEATLGILSTELSVTQTYGVDVGLRAGYLLTSQTLAYVLGGYAWQRLKGDSGGDALGADNTDGDGFTVGTGLETSLGGNWTLRNEYRYASYSFDTEGELESDVSTHTYRVGVNYRFGAESGSEATFAAPVYNWTGFYVGAQAGVATGKDQLSLLGILTYDGPGADGGWGSLNVGYDHEFGSMWVVGVQAGARYMSVDTSVDINTTLDRDYGFDLLARIGAKANEATLAYVIGGYTHQHFESNAIGEESDWNDGGYTIGAGLETAVTSNLTLNFEYRFSQFDDHDAVEAEPGLAVFEPSFHTFGVGLKYKFNN